MSRLCLVGASLPEKCFRELTYLGYDVLKLPENERLPYPVSTHLDMSVKVIGCRLYLFRDYYELCKRLFTDNFVRKLCICAGSLGRDYPHDIRLNMLTVSKYLIGRLDMCPTELLSAATELGLEPIRCRQGYAACSTCVVGDAAITQDVGMHRLFERLGVPSLLVSGAIRLDGYGSGYEGFIGGASGYDSDSRCVFFAGSLDAHPDGAKIRKFCSYHGVRAYSLSDETLFDCGGIIFVN